MRVKVVSERSVPAPSSSRRLTVTVAGKVAGGGFNVTKILVLASGGNASESNRIASVDGGGEPNPVGEEPATAGGFDVTPSYSKKILSPETALSWSDPGTELVSVRTILEFTNRFEVPSWIRVIENPVESDVE